MDDRTLALREPVAIVLVGESDVGHDRIRAEHSRVCKVADRRPTEVVEAEADLGRVVCCMDADAAAQAVSLLPRFAKDLGRTRVRPRRAETHPNSVFGRPVVLVVELDSAPKAAFDRIE